MQIVHDDPPMEDEIAAGFYPGFERKWRLAERIGLVAMVAFVAICALGLLGKGLFSIRSAQNSDGTISIRYEPVVRFGAPTDLSFITKVPPGGDKVAVTMAQDLADHFGLESITPRPSLWQASKEGIRMEFPVNGRPDYVSIRFAGSPNFLGRIKLWARLDKGENLTWSHYSVP